MPFLDRFRRSADPPPPATEPDDPRVSVLASEIAEAHGMFPPWLIWSGSLLGEGDPAAEATALVRRKWWEFNGEGKLREIDERFAVQRLTWVVGNSLAYEVEVMTSKRASELTANYVALMPSPRRWFTNTDFTSDGNAAWTPATNFTFDTGFVTVAEGRAWIAWFTDED